jgi:hypothetical protein
LHRAFQQLLTPTLPGANSGRHSNFPGTGRLPDGSRTVRDGDDPNHGPRSSSPRNRPGRRHGTHSDGRSCY